MPYRDKNYYIRVYLPRWRLRKAMEQQKQLETFLRSIVSATFPANPGRAEEVVRALLENTRTPRQPSPATRRLLRQLQQGDYSGVL